MGIISYNKKQLISLLRYLNTKPGFSRLFYWIHEIRRDELKTNKFIAVEMDDGYFLGCYDYRIQKAWKRFVGGLFEASDVIFIKKISPYFNCFIDIGAHIGYYSCLINKLNPESKIFAFEPSMTNFKSLKKNLEINNATNAKLYPIGLGVEKEKSILYGTDADGSIIEGTYPQTPSQKISVDIDRLDNYIDDIPQHASVFIKIDVEGNEYFTLKGGLGFIKKTHPVGLMVEIVRYWSGGENPNFFNTFSFIEKCGYDAYKKGEGAKLQEVYGKEETVGGNYIFLRKDLSSKLKNI